jgi:predicted transcriptional regulator
MTPEQKTRVQALILAIADTIKELSPIPSGHLYAALLGTQMSLDTYQQIISALEKAGKIKVSNNLITWIDNTKN